MLRSGREPWKRRDQSEEDAGPDARRGSGEAEHAPVHHDERAILTDARQTRRC